VAVEPSVEDDSSNDTGATITPAQILAMLQMQWPVIVAFTLTVALVTLLVNLRAEKVYQATATLKLTPQVGQEVDVDQVGDFDQQTRNFNYANTQVDIIRSRSLLEEVAKRYVQAGYDDVTPDAAGAGELAGMLTIVPRPDTELIDLSIRCNNPDRCAVMANLITEVYKQKNLEGRQEGAEDAIKWCDEQIVVFQGKIVDASRTLIEYQSANDLADAEEKVTELTSKLNALSLAYGTVNTDRVLLATTVTAHERLLAAGQYNALAKDMATPLVLSLTNEYSSAVTEQAIMKARYLEKNPERRSAEARVAGIEAEIEAEVRRQLAAEKAELNILERKEADLQTALDESKTQLLERERVHEDYERLKNDLQIAKDTYEQLNSRRNDLHLASKTTFNNVRIIDPARPSHYAIEPRISQNLMIGILVGLICGVAIGLLREYLDDTVTSPLDVTAYLRVPFLGVFPRLAHLSDDRERAMYTHDHPSSAAAEAMRAMRTVLELSPDGKPVRRFMITSSVSAEGKTSTTVNLGISFANLGRRVVLVDADLRRPRLHHLFDVPRENGVTSVLGGMPLEAALFHSPVSGLDILAAGPVVARPNELLASAGMRSLVEELSNRYDIVLIDTPPAAMLSDAAIVSKLVDGVVIVVREHTVSRALIRDVLHRLQQVNAPMLGVVLNAVDISGRSSRYYAYAYGYRYRYYDQYYDESAQGQRVAK
jgi:succinoglycan biosynthesis transport protein ExoP